MAVKNFVDCKEKELGSRRYRCFFDLALMVIGGKWKPGILNRLAEHNVLRFSNLRRSIPSITERMLARQLKELESDGLVTRRVLDVVPPHVEYSLSELGETLIPVLQVLRDWGESFERHMAGDKYFAEEGFEPYSCSAGGRSTCGKVLP